MERLEAKIYGRVQMVLFRDFAKRAARRFKLTGYARNENDGSVSVVAEGMRENLDEYLRELSGGPILAKVERVETAWKKAEGKFRDFNIDYS